jgi:hypothetical protein
MTKATVTSILAHKAVKAAAGESAQDGEWTGDQILQLIRDHGGTWVGTIDGRKGLATLVGWDRMTLTRQIDKWVAEKVLAKAKHPGNKTVLTLLKGDHVKISRVLRLRQWWSTVSLNWDTVFGVALLIVAFSILGMGLRINAWYGEKLGSDPAAQSLFAGLSVAADALCFLMPEAASVLWHKGRRVSAWLCGVILAAVLVGATLATIGFTSTNIADAGAVRSSAVKERADLEKQIAELEASKKELDKPARWASEAKTHAAQADRVKADLEEARGKLKALPAVDKADPQTEAAAQLTAFVSRGAFSVSSGSVSNVRMLGFVVLPQFSGLVFMMGMGMLRREKR